MTLGDDPVQDALDEGVIHYSRGRDTFDAYPEQRTAESFSEFAKAVLSDRSRAKGLTWISASFKPNSDGRHHRCRNGALPRGFIAFDLDGATPDAFAELCMTLGKHSGFGYTTASHTAELPHARYILELSRPVDRAEGIRLGAAMQRQVEARLGPGAVNLDPSVYRAEQPIYGPLQNADVMRYHGDPVDVDQVLKDAPPLEEKPGLAERAAKAASQDPVVHVLANRGMIKRDHGDGKLSIVCPFEDSHTEPGSESSTVYFLPNFGGVRYGKFKCLHDHCAERTTEQFLTALGLDPREVWRAQSGGAAPYDDLPPVESYDEAAQEDARRHTAGAKTPAGDEARSGNGAAPGGSCGGEKDKKADAAAVAEVIETAINKLVTDIGAVFEPEVITALKAVRESKPADYQRYRKRIKDAGASVAELDRLVCVCLRSKGDDAQGAPVLFPDIERWAEPVDGAKLLTDLMDPFKRYAIPPDHADVALALWGVFTHCIDAVSVAPILALTSPEKRCGKSTVLAVLGRLVQRPLPAANISTAALFRSVEAWYPTLLIDEADSFLRNSDEMRGILNSGHTRDSAFVVRTVGDDHEPRRFSTWGAKAIALIGKLPDTLADRSIEIPLKRKLPGEHAERLRHAAPETFHNLARRCARWAGDNAEKIRAARPSMPEGLHDRAADNWEPLLAIAELAGGPWPERARKAALALSGAVDAETDTLRVQLLSDIRDVFKVRGVEGAPTRRLPTVELIAKLVALEDRPWGEVNRGKPISARWLAARLRPFGIVVGPKREGDEVFKGYKLDQFADAFKRYLPPPEDPPLDRPQDTTPSEDPTSDRLHGYNVGGARVSEDSASVTKPQCNRSQNGPEPSCDAGCNRVTDSEPSLWETRL